MGRARSLVANTRVTDWSAFLSRVYLDVVGTAGVVCLERADGGECNPPTFSADGRGSVCLSVDTEAKCVGLIRRS